MENNTGKIKILAIETSGKTFSAAIAEGAAACQIRGEVFFDVGLRHSEILKGSCVYLLNAAGWKKQDLSHIAVCAGPGSFTGIRVGISFARALSQALKIPLVGMSGFEILAARARRLGIEEPLCICFESIGYEVFAGFFAKGKTRPKRPYEIKALPDLVMELERWDSAACLGGGCAKYGSELQNALGGKLRHVPEELMHPRAETLAQLAFAKVRARNPLPRSWKKIIPLYMRPPLAVERLKKGSKS